jgi:hypothetical protein
VVVKSPPPPSKPEPERARVPWERMAAAAVMKAPREPRVPPAPSRERARVELAAVFWK